MKNILRSIFALVALAVASIADAQSFNQQYIFPPGRTVNIAAASTNTTMYLTNSAMAFIHSEEFSAFQPTFTLTGSGTSPCVFTFGTSVDGAVWNTGAFTISVTPNGTNKVAGVLNQLTGSIPFVRLEGITNPNASAMTNVYVAVTAKTFPF